MSIPTLLHITEAAALADSWGMRPTTTLALLTLVGCVDADPATDDVTLEIAEGGKYTVVIAGQKDVGTVHVDSAKKPAEMDIKGTDGPNKGKTIKTIYKLDGNTLVICYELGDGARPTKFETTASSKQLLATYKRQKK